MKGTLRTSTLHLLGALALTAATGGVAVVSCSSSDAAEAPPTVCDPGATRFCRCAGSNESGSHVCNDEGNGFITACIGQDGPCAEPGDNSSGGEEDIICVTGNLVPCTCDDGAEGNKSCFDDGTGFGVCECGPGTPTGASSGGGSGSTSSSERSAVSSGGGDSSGPSSSASTSGDPPGDKLLFEPCSADAQCISAKCHMGYCTQDCFDFSDCPPGQGECVTFNDVTVCRQLCKTQAQCDLYGFPSECGYALAVDNVPVTTCADWKEDLQVMPDGSACMEEQDCTLGHAGKEVVCSFETCVVGACYEDNDCPSGTFCPSDGSLLATCE